MSRDRGNHLPRRTKCVSVYSVVTAPTKIFEVANLKRIEFRGDVVPKDLARMFDKRTAKQVSHTCVIRAKQGSKEWDWKAQVFGRWNGFKIEFID